MMTAIAQIVLFGQLAREIAYISTIRTYGRKYID